MRVGCATATRSPSGHRSRAGDAKGTRRRRAVSAATPEDIAFTRQMGLTHAEFFRILPPVVADVSHRVEPVAVHIEDGARRAVLTLGPQTDRRLGIMRLPAFELRFEFSGYSTGEVDGFMARFDRCFHRGGG